MSQHHCSIAYRSLILFSCVAQRISFFLKHKFHHTMGKLHKTSYKHIYSRKIISQKMLLVFMLYAFLCMCSVVPIENMLMVLKRYNGNVDQKEKSNATMMTRLRIWHRVHREFRHFCATIFIYSLLFQLFNSTTLTIYPSLYFFFSLFTCFHSQWCAYHAHWMLLKA